MYRVTARLRIAVVFSIVVTATILVSTFYRSRAEGGEAAMLPPVGASLAVADVAGTVDGNADPGDTLEYTLTITNGGTDATAVSVTSTLSNLTTLDSTFANGGVQVAPLVLNDTYSVTGNVRIQPSTAAGLLANDVNPFTGNNTGLTFTTTTITSAQCVVATCPANNVTINADGSFAYNPPPGYEGADSFSYAVTNAGGGSATGTVTLTVSGMIWFVQNGAPACSTLAAGCGRLTTPFSSLANFQAINNGATATALNPAINDNIFLYENATAYAGGTTLLNGQKLIGQDSTSTLISITGLTLAPDSDALPAMDSGNGTVTNVQNAVGNSVTLTNVGAGGTNTVNGLTLGNASGAALSGTAFGTLTVGSLIVNTNGNAIALGTGAVTGSFNSVTSSGGTINVSLNTVTGTVALGTGALSGASVTGFIVTGGTAAITYSGTISKTSAGQIINIGTHATGNITLSGNLICNSGCSGINMTGNTSGTITLSGGTKTLSTGTSAAVTLATNSGATINFSNGGLDIDTTSGTAFTATVSGTVSVTTGANPNTIDSTTGTALNVANVTIGATGLTFRRISSSGAASGIVLNNTGASGGLTVAGDGDASSNGSGGVIQNSTGIGVSLTSTRDVNLGYLNITGSADTGLKGISVTNFILNRSNINSNGNSTSDEGIQFGEFSGTTVGVTGAVSITNSSVSTNAHNNVHFRSTSGNISSLTVTGSTFSNVNDTTGANSFLFEASGTSTVTVATMSGCTFGNNAPQRSLEVQTHDTATISNFTVNSNTWTDSGIHASFTQDTSSNLDFNLTNNNMTGANPLQAVNVFSSSTATGGTITGEISGNIIGNAAVAGSGSTGGPGIRILVQGQTDSTFLINNNTIRQAGFTNGARGMDLQFLGSVTTGLGLTSLNDVTITNNFVQTDAPAATFPLAAIFLSADNQGSPARVRADIRSNTVPATGSFDYPSFDGVNGGQLCFVNVTAGAVAQLVDNAPASATPLAELQSHNTGKMYADASPNVTLIAGPIGTPPIVPPAEESGFGVSGEFQDNIIEAVAVVDFNGTEPVVQPVETETRYLAAFTETVGRIFGMISPTVYAQDVKTADEKPAAPESGETITINGGGSGFLLGAGKTLTVKYRAKVNNGPYSSGVNTIDNFATANGSNFATITSNTASINLDAAPDLAITSVTDAATVTQPGGVIAYTVNYTNNTAINGQNAANVVLSQVVPTNTTFSVAASAPTVWSGCADGAAAGSTCTLAVGSLNDAATGSAKFGVTVLPNLGATALTVVNNGASIAENPNVNGTDRVAANNSNAASPDTDNVQGIWIGGTNVNWSVSTNWSNSLLPGSAPITPATQNISVPTGGGANSPTVDTSQTINNMVLAGKDLTIAAGQTLNANGLVSLGTNSVQGATGTLALSSTGTISRTSGQVNGTLSKVFGATGNFTFPVGVSGNGYSPVDANVTTVGTLSAKATFALPPSTPAMNAAKTLKRYWTMNGSGGIVADVTYNYLATDVPATAVEANFYLIRITSSGSRPFGIRPNGTTLVLNTAVHSMKLFNQAAFSDWTLAEPVAPTAANAEIGGRVLDSGGRGVSGVLMQMTDLNGSVRYATTNPFGYYRFTGLSAGDAVTLAPTSKRFHFAPRAVSVNEDLTAVDFTPIE